MAEGAYSEAVFRLQVTLKRCYGANIATDSHFGPATKSALISAQRRENIAADGIYGTETRNNLDWSMDGYCPKVALPIRVA
ncbi:peptidoglycan-binding domain-containing protein [Salinispora tropica]|uniref:peptidoglycan-binding domain-containing protein n=1 Tax=Salinispora tropica TaxID=168695 RepID=UPI003B75C11B